MSWIQKLYETYNNSQKSIGAGSDDDDIPLLPVSHTTQKAQIELVIDGEGNFRRAGVIPKGEARTIIPCSEGSGGRTSGAAPHPLCDKLQYIAKDYPQFVTGKKKSYFGAYLDQLEAWNNPPFSDPKITAILKYVKRGRVIADLVESGVLFLDSASGKFIEKDKSKGADNPKIFEVLTDQEDAFVRWVVEIPGAPETKVWQDQVLWDKWAGYYAETKADKSLCYVTGNIEFTADQHPAKIRNDGDKAKLISSNDTSGFTFRGRFRSAEQAAAVGFVTTQKAHSALRWLIGRQGYRRGDLAIVAWAVNGKSVPSPMDDPITSLMADVPAGELITDTAQDLAIRFKKKIAGYGTQLGDTSDIVVMGLDSATPGRMAMIYFRELTGSDYIHRIDNWHETCAWLHQYRVVEVLDQNGKVKKRSIPFIGAPSPNDIAEAVYGVRLDEKLRKATIARILPCIIDGQPLPRDLVESTVRRASNRVSMEPWEWEKTLSIACALFRKYQKKESYSMALDPNRVSRDYLYGRLLALADSLEDWALGEAGEKRQTNAARLMQRFAERPYSTWRTIELALAPYKARLGGKSLKRQWMIDEVISSFNPEDFTNDKRLSGEFLLGYHSQRQALRTSSGNNKETDQDKAAE